MGTTAGATPPPRIGLRRSVLTTAGITRAGDPKAWRFLAPSGEPVAAEDEARCRELVLPPAWRDVWICVHANGHIQAVGTDAAGRRQYRYHPQWTADRAIAKFDRVLDAARVLPEVRSQAHDALKADGLTRDRVLGCAVRLLELGFFRVGSEIYAEENGTFGLATIRREHVTMQPERVAFDYRAKSGKQRHSAVADPLVRACIQELLDRDDPNPELLGWWDADRERWVDVHSDDINDHLRQLSGADLTAKDFRTWSATVLCAIGLAVSTGAADSPTARKRAVTRAVAETATYLGNTPTVCRASYIHPRLMDLYDDGVTIADELAELGASSGPGDFAFQGAVESAVLAMLVKPLAARRRAARSRRAAGRGARGTATAGGPADAPAAPAAPAAVAA